MTYCLRWLIVVALLPIALPSLTALQRSEVVVVDGRRVEVIRRGAGTPTLVLESGGGAGAEAWEGVLPQLADLTRVVAYSRAGHGGSDPTAVGRSPQSIVEELHHLLQVLKKPGPFVLIGKSIGGLFARLYVSKFPTEVAGLVLVDATHEAQFARWDVLRPGSRIADSIRAILPSVPPAARADYELILKIHHAGRVDGLLPLPDLPLAVITALKPCPPGDDWTCRDPQALTVWRELHDEWFATSSRALRIVSARSGHDVVGDQPALIVDAVRFVINEVRSQADNVRGSSKKK
jgi:pimeloyl-ACP methyl ester carboxylesterase